MKKVTALIGATMLGVTLLAAPPATAAQPATVQAALKDYSVKKRNDFWRLVTTYEPMAKYGGKKNVIGLGVATCDLLRAGGTIEDLALLLLESDYVWMKMLELPGRAHDLAVAGYGFQYDYIDPQYPSAAKAGTARQAQTFVLFGLPLT